MQTNQTKAVELLGELKTKANQTKDKAKGKAIIVFKDLKSKTIQTKDKSLVLMRDPHFQVCTVATAGGAITFGSIGGTFGLVSGMVVGSAVGVVPALFTMGLSIPAGATIGGVGGLCAGTLIGTTSGGFAGFTVYKYRIEIKNGVMTIKVKTHEALESTKSKAGKAWNGASEAVNLRVHKFQVRGSAIANNAKKNSIAAVELAKTKASDAYNFATTTKVGVTSTSAVAGAVVGGTTTGAVGTVAGAAAGVPLAIFTFGLSIPVGAMFGLCAGTAVGGSAGAVGGGVVGYTGFTHGKAISEAVKSSVNKAGTKAEELKTKTFLRAAEAKESVKSMVRASGTGGSAHDKDD